MPIIDPAVLAKVGRLDLKAKVVVEGYVSGMHRSPYKGFSVEFAQHRGYVPGDDLKHLDWKVWGKAERYYIKQYEAETNLVCHLLLDSSTSMLYAGAKAHAGMSKLAWGQLAAAALAHMVLSQSDAVSCSVFTDELAETLPVSSKKAHLHRICAMLEGFDPAERTGVGAVLNQLAARLQRRGVVVAISDFFDDLDEMADGLAHLRHRGHEVVVVHVLDGDEMEFVFDGMVQFHDLEGPVQALAHPRSIRTAYLAELEKYLARFRSICRKTGVDHVLADTRHGVDAVLSAYMAAREHAAGAGAGVRGGMGR